jgi:DNA polymerase-3 subunit delta'
MGAFPDFFGNEQATATLAQMLQGGRIPQTILLSGAEGIGKATLVRRFGAALLGGAAKIERDDLSLPQNVEVTEQREKWPAEKRSDDPLFFGSHPDFLTFAPDGPLQQISIQQMRLLRERAQFKPLRGARRIFLIDHLDHANEQAANSLLKLLEEPPEHLIVFATAENLYDLLPTIRSRSIVLQMGRLSDEEMQDFARARTLPDAAARIALSGGSPGMAVTFNLQQFRDRRELLLAAFECGCGIIPWYAWVQHSESFATRKSEKLDFYLKPAYGILEDVLRVLQGRPPGTHRDILQRIEVLSRRIDYRWIDKAVHSIDELVLMARRNIQKLAALDAMIINLRNHFRNDAIFART